MFNPRKIKPVVISGREVLPIVEGGKGIAVTNSATAGAFAAAGAVGTFSGVNPQRFDAQNHLIPYEYLATTRTARHEELVAQSIAGGIQQAKNARDICGKEGRIHMNVLWEMGGCERVLEGILNGAPGLVNGVTCGAGMPYKLGEICAHHKVYYYPIISSARAFNALWKRAYSKTADWMGAVVYEDPWLAGGHNGLSNSEDPKVPQDPYPRVAELRKVMNSYGLQDKPVIMAGGVWHIAEWDHWLDNPEIGPVAFQYGTRPILTQESPVSEEWKKRLLTLKEGDVFLNNFSPTGFYSSAVDNDFIEELRSRGERQVEYRPAAEGEFTEALPLGARGRPVYLKKTDIDRARSYLAEGFTEGMKTPDESIIFVTPEKGAQIHTDQVECMGCLSQCRFSNWKDKDDFTTGKRADPRSFCIQKTLQDIAHGAGIDNELMFSGHNAYRFGTDPFYAGGFVPTVKQLIERMMTGY